MAPNPNLEQLTPAKRAVYEIRQLRNRVEELDRLRNEPVAIVGMGLRFPGDASTPEDFWNLLARGTDTVAEIPPSRWPLDMYYDADPDAPGKMYARHASLLADPALFDADFFGILPREAMALDPQHRLALEVTWEALENAGVNPAGLSQSNAGVFLALGNSDYGRMAFHNTEGIDVYTATGNVFSVAAGRISYVLGLTGPSVALDTACSGSLVAVHLACQSLRAGECSMALAGGVNLILSPELNVNFSRSRMLARDGRCKTFDAAADGYVRAEGCGMLVLKRLSEVEARNDRILAIIRGSAVNQDGRSGGLTVPSGPAQESVIRQALAHARIEPERIGYVEAHGTGTALGDPIEAHALVAALGGKRGSDNPLVIGSVKTNLGHLEAAAGVAGLIKTVLALEHRQIPPHLHFHRLNPHIDWNGVPVEIPVCGRPWPTGALPRVAGVSSFGFSGTNAHVILEEAPFREAEAPKMDRPLHILALSARTDAALSALRASYSAELAHSPAALADICYTANAGRAQFAERAVYIGSSADAVLQTPIPRGRAVARPEVVFLFPGQSAQYAGMGKELFDTQPVFRQALEQCAAHLSGEIDTPLNEILWGAATQLLNQTKYTQLALFSIEYALARLWQSWGIEPAVVLGHGVGEYVAACVAGVFSLSDGLKLIAAQMSETEDAFERVAAGISYGEPRLELISTISGQPTRLVSQPERFAAAMERLAKHKVFLEAGPGATLADLGRQCLKQEDQERMWVTSLRQGRGEWEQMLESLGKLYVRGADINWQGFDAPYQRRKVALPTYPFERQRYWIASKPALAASNGKNEWESVCEAASNQSHSGGLDLNVASYPRRWALLDQLTQAYICATFLQLGAFHAAGEHHTAASLIERCGIEISYDKLIGRWLSKLSRHGLLRQDGETFTAVAPLPIPDMERIQSEADAAFQGDRVFLDYVLRCGRNLSSILAGRMSPLETLFPGGDFTLAEDLYERAPMSSYFRDIGRATLEAFVRGRRQGTFRVLEVGAGTGSTASALLPVLPSDASEYHFTDVSEAFLNHGKRKFAQYPFVRFGRFDIELESSGQSDARAYAEGSFDVVAATNVLHATRDIRSTVRRVKSLLAPGGILILCEVTEYLPWFDVTTSLIEGWDLFEDGVRGDHPLLAPETWKSVLMDAGFEAVSVFPEPGSPAEVLGQRVLVARVSGVSSSIRHRPVASGSVQIQPSKVESTNETTAEILGILDAPPIQRHENLVSLMRRHIAEMLRFPSPESVERKRRLQDLGLDSLMALEFSSRLTKSLGLERALGSTLVFDHPTLDALADYIEDDILHLALQPDPADESVDTLDARAEELEQLADSEVEALLLKRLQAL